MKNMMCHIIIGGYIRPNLHKIPIVYSHYDTLCTMKMKCWTMTYICVSIKIYVRLGFEEQCYRQKNIHCIFTIDFFLFLFFFFFLLRKHYSWVSRILLIFIWIHFFWYHFFTYYWQSATITIVIFFFFFFWVCVYRLSWIQINLTHNLNA